MFVTIILKTCLLYYKINQSSIFTTFFSMFNLEISEIIVFPAKWCKALYPNLPEPKSTRPSGKVQQMAVWFYLKAAARAWQLFPWCCHLLHPVQNEGGTDLRISRTIITQLERHGCRQIYDPYHGAASKRLFAVKRKRLIKTRL